MRISKKKPFSFATSCNLSQAGERMRISKKLSVLRQVAVLPAILLWLLQSSTGASSHHLIKPCKSIYVVDHHNYYLRTPSKSIFVCDYYHYHLIRPCNITFVVDRLWHSQSQLHFGGGIITKQLGSQFFLFLLFPPFFLQNSRSYSPTI